MRSIFLVLLLANLLVFVWQFDVVRDFVWRSDRGPVASQLNAERLRIIRDTSAPSRVPASPAPPAQSPG